jgi:replicative DNA helicase
MEKITKKSLEKLPPHDIEAEQAVVGACFLDNEKVFACREWMHPEDFYQARHTKIFQAMTTLCERNEPADLLTVRAELIHRECLDEIGGPAYLAALVDAIPTAANIEYHAKQVHEKAVARELLHLSIETATRCYADTMPVQETLTHHEEQLFVLAEQQTTGTVVPYKDVILSSYEHISVLAERDTSVLGLATGFPDLDRLTLGFMPADLIILAARPSMGKTALALQWAHAFALKQIPVAFFSLEMSKEQLGMRSLAIESKCNSHNLRTGKVTADDWESLAFASEILSKAPIFIDDTPALTVFDLRSKVRRLKREKQIGAVIVDYLQLMEAGIRKENRVQEVSFISRQLKKVAKELSIPVIALSQLNRAVEERADKHPKLADLRESGALEQDADCVFFLYRPEVYGIPQTEGLAELSIGKQRNGPLGTVKLLFLKESTCFESLYQHESPTVF